MEKKAVKAATPKRGRPVAGAELSSQNIHIRIDAETRAAWEAAAEADGRTLSGWIRVSCQKNLQS